MIIPPEIAEVLNRLTRPNRICWTATRKKRKGLKGARDRSRGGKVTLKMKLASYTHRHTTSCGIVTDAGMIDIPSHTEGSKKLHSVKEILIKGKAAFETLEELAADTTVTVIESPTALKAPIPRPGKVLALAGNYLKHLQETGTQAKAFENQAVSTNPWPFLMPSTTITGADHQIPWPAYSEQVDYEVELAVFIGETAAAITPDQAGAHIAGYSVGNDISARSTTFAEGRKDREKDGYFDWLMGKWSNGFLPLGPVLVTADEIEDPQNLAIELKVNGEIRQQSNTSRMIFNVNQIVSFISHLMTLEPGDVIVTGTPHGVAAGGMSEFLNPGDTIEATIEKIGTLTNTLGPKPETFYRGFIR